MQQTPDHAIFKLAYLHPRYWGTWFLLCVMRISILLPLTCQIAIGRCLGNIIFLLIPSRKRIARTNIQLCFPELNEAEVQHIAKKSFQNAGISIFETAMAWWASDERLAKLHDIEGGQYIQTVHQDKHTILLLSGHFSSTELGGRLLRLHYDFQAMYKPAKNKLYNAFMWRSRSKHFSIVERKNSKQFIRQLKKGMLSWYAPDQNLASEEHVFAPFFNTPTLTITATSRIANITKATVIPFLPIREGSRYKLIFQKPLHAFPSNNNIDDASKVNAAIEHGIKIDPSQYLWAHKRFHTLPDGSKRKYQ